MRKIIVAVGILLTCKMVVAQSSANDFILSKHNHSTCIFVGKGEREVVKIAANSLKQDISDVTGYSPSLVSDTNALKGSIVIIGTVTNPLIEHLCEQYDMPDIKGKWEHFFIRVLNDSFHSSRKILLIAGSDSRGAAYGVFTLSRIIGVSPWKWWADVTPPKKKDLIIDKRIDIEEGPSVKYRGIFLNDEDWGLRPWASKTFEPELGNIGPKTYAKVFELLLRLKANTIWPAMHRGTTPFFEVSGNEAVAKKYDIVIGTAHNEPMTRDNAVEWHRKTMGPFNYVTNRDSVYAYWKRRVVQVAKDNIIYTVGMRGTGDSRMEGVTTLSQEAAVLSEVFKDQRELLRKYVNPHVQNVPQVFIPYKEVLPVYDEGLQVPDDVTLMWPDDNYGYIRRLSNTEERQRSGSSGIYYHVSYNGSPQDYLWLSTSQPGLIYEEMKKAWNYGARRMWIVNVGDIKPAEYDIEFILDMAWNIHSIQADNIIQHLRHWASSTFGQGNADAIAEVKDAYYRLAFIRRPEFMGWNRTYPNTPVRSTAFYAFLDRDEIAHRVKAYQRLIAKVDRIKENIPAGLQNAYFELITYPVKGAAYMNEKFLYAQKSRLFAQYDLPVSNYYASLCRLAYDSIRILTQEYNNLDNGKWKDMMDRSPRGLPVFQLPELSEEIKTAKKGIVVWPEGQTVPMVGSMHNKLPAFNPYNATHHFIDLLNSGMDSIKWEARADENWITLSKASGILKAEYKLVVTIDWNRLPAGTHEGALTIGADDSVYNIKISVEPSIKGKTMEKPIVEQDDHVFIQANEYAKKKDYSKSHRWVPIEELGYSDSAYAILPSPSSDTEKLRTAYLEYRFYTYSKGPAKITVFTLPTQPVNNKHGMRITVSVDNNKKQILSYKTEETSEQWKQNVLSNHARCDFNYDFSTGGWHTIKIYPWDPGVVLDQIMVNFNASQKIYGISF